MTIRRYDKRNYHSVGIVIDDGQEEESDILYCENCYKVGVLTKLKGRVYLDMSGKLLVNPPPDAEDWLQCCTFVVISLQLEKPREKEGYRAYLELNPLIIPIIMAKV